MIRVRGRSAFLALVGLSFLACASTAMAVPISFKVPLSAAEQIPPVEAAGYGTADLSWDPATRVVTWRIDYSNMCRVTMAHFDYGARGHNGPVAIWLTKKGEPVKSPIVGTATLSPKEATEFEAGDWYINVHTKDHPEGEVRGQVVPPKP